MLDDGLSETWHLMCIPELSFTNTSYTLCSPIPLPSTLFTAESTISEIKGVIRAFEVEGDVVVMQLHSQSQMELVNVYNMFMNSPVNRWVQGEVRRGWKTEFYEQMKTLRWRVNARGLVVDTGGHAHLAQEYCGQNLADMRKRQCYGHETIRELCYGHRQLRGPVQDVVKVSIMELFRPGPTADKTMWEIPYRLGDNHSLHSFPSNGLQIECYKPQKTRRRRKDRVRRDEDRRRPPHIPGPAKIGETRGGAKIRTSLSQNQVEVSSSGGPDGIEFFTGLDGRAYVYPILNSLSVTKKKRDQLSLLAEEESSMTNRDEGTF
ncbi:hypothetical protein EDC01DRAFT_627306 [Geopyxis carbonaria]|nr:hypothetical protein EDC01DRAFT_627306 [Geopyxis carbonaria]